MHKIGDVLKLHIDGGSDLAVGRLWKAGVPQGGVESKLVGKRSLHTMIYIYIYIYIYIVMLS